MEPARPAPKVLTWYRVYCAAMLAIYLACAVGGFFVMLFHEQIAGVRAAGRALAVALLRRRPDPARWRLRGGLRLRVLRAAPPLGMDLPSGAHLPRLDELLLHAGLDPAARVLAAPHDAAVFRSASIQ